MKVTSVELVDGFVVVKESDGYDSSQQLRFDPEAKTTIKRQGTSIEVLAKEIQIDDEISLRSVSSVT